MTDVVAYVYGVVLASRDAAAAPRGLDGTTVEAERSESGEIAALLSEVDAATYATTGGAAESRAGDVEWVGPRAVAHDAVLTWASGLAGEADSEPAGVVPFPMFALFTNRAAVRAMLAERESVLRATLARVTGAQELSVRVFRDDAVLAGALPRLSERVAALDEAARLATPGQRYLLERKRDADLRAELRRVSAEAAGTIFERLRTASADAVREPLPPRGEQEPAAVLKASFLVRDTARDAFTTALDAVVAEYEPLGLRVELTGPWPPYHFVGER